ncbi:MAG: hypothetical protein LBH93_01775 [Chitinispirillales bacterium]|jgi:hypothetical protein|nr:hypothetical protein [Chitinispirillales bacterium]
MKSIDTETKSYVLLARRGDPSAFYALFCGHIRNIYLLHRSQGKDHKGACDAASETLGRAYRRFVRWGAGNPGKWFAARCGVARFDPAAAGSVASEVELASYEKIALRAVNKAYSARLSAADGSAGGVEGGRRAFRYAVGSAAAAVILGLLFFSGAIFSVKFERAGAEYKVSFPRIAEGLWEMSGLVRSGAPPSRGAKARPPGPGADGAETPQSP